YHQAEEIEVTVSNLSKPSEFCGGRDRRRRLAPQHCEASEGPHGPILRLRFAKRGRLPSVLQRSCKCYLGFVAGCLIPLSFGELQGHSFLRTVFSLLSKWL